ncbi:MAG: hypothetical protein Q9225_004362 [Loekoesia sp. 1 TL-2023]
MFMFSTSELLTTSLQIVTADTISDSITSQLSKCPSDTYVIVTQPAVHAHDYQDRYVAPYLRKKIQGEDDRIRSSISIPDVLGNVDTDSIIKSIEANCGAALMKVDASTGSFAIADDPKPRVINLEFPSLPTGNKRASQLQENGIHSRPYPSKLLLPSSRSFQMNNNLAHTDAFLSSLIDLLPTSKFTVIYTTTPFSSTSTSSTANIEPEMYEMDTSFSSQTHMELKRDFAAYSQSANNSSSGNVTLPNAPLFEKYAYLSPGEKNKVDVFEIGIFMALLVIVPLFLILYVGVTGVASLQVSYAAFDREMGPAAQQKKQQQ